MQEHEGGMGEDAPQGGREGELHGQGGEGRAKQRATPPTGSRASRARRRSRLPTTTSAAGAVGRTGRTREPSTSGGRRAGRARPASPRESVVTS